MSSLVAFQAASSFASADVMYNISSPPFVFGGYTVAEFEVSATHCCPVYDTHTYAFTQLPDVVNGTVYANRSAILNQASCVAPDSVSSVAIVHGNVI